MFIDAYKKIHCIGVGGIGISGIAKFLRVKGKTVTGSDAARSAVTAGVEAIGITVFIGHDAAHLADDVDLVVYSEAVPEENPERVKARERGIPELGHFDFLGSLSKEYRTICVTGTNGKSTTTAMLAKIFETANMDPTAFVGSLVPGWKYGNVRVGSSDFLIVEGDEYKQKMVKLFPETTVITNIEEDHLDVYRDLAHIIATFQELVDKTTGPVFLNVDDKNSLKIVKRDALRYAYYTGNCEFHGYERAVTAGRQEFTLFDNGKVAGRIPLMIPGEFNMMNALAAAAVARRYGVHMDYLIRALQTFPGIWRRFERVGTWNGADIVSDYGHHPSAIAQTLEGAKEFFPGRRVVLCFQPHQHSRTKMLFDDFVKSFAGADLLILPEIYHVEGRNEEEGKISSKDFLPFYPKAIFSGGLDETEAVLRKEIQPGDVVIIMGAGNIDEVARRLVK